MIGFRYSIKTKTNRPRIKNASPYFLRYLDTGLTASVKEVKSLITVIGSVESSNSLSYPSFFETKDNLSL